MPTTEVSERLPEEDRCGSKAQGTRPFPWQAAVPLRRCLRGLLDTSPALSSDRTLSWQACVSNGMHMPLMQKPWSNLICWKNCHRCCVLQAEHALAAAAKAVQEQQELISQLELSVRSAERARRLDAAFVHQMPCLEKWHSMQVELSSQAGCCIAGLGSLSSSLCPKHHNNTAITSHRCACTSGAPASLTPATALLAATFCAASSPGAC